MIFAQSTEQLTAEELEALIKCSFTARDAIVAARRMDGKVTPGSTKIDPCPCCGRGTLHGSVASNGHVWARCSGLECVSFCE